MCSILGLFVPVWAQQAAVSDETPGSRISGKIKATDGGGLGGARVLAYHLSSEKLYTSEPTGSGGDFTLVDLPYGYFDVAVETPEGLYVATQVVNLPPSGKIGAVLTITPYAADGSSQPRSFPGSGAPSVGVTEVKEKPRGRDFWTSPKGIAILAGIGGVALLAIASSGDSEDPASAFVP